MAFLLAAPGAPAAAGSCGAGSLARCPVGSLDPAGRAGPLTRADIDARIGIPGAPIADAVTEDVSRTWEAVRRRPAFPVIAYPSDPPHMERKGDMR